MIVPLESYALGVFLVLCRIGACLMIMPGFGSARVPGRVRILLALALSMVVTPLVAVPGALDRNDGAHLLRLIFSECFAGGTIGLLARMYIAALEFMGSAIASYMGLAGMGSAIELDEPAPAVSAMITIVATLLMLVMDLHLLLISTVIQSYAELPLGEMPSTRNGLRMLADALTAGFLMALQISGPFVVYGVVVNVMFGLVGKLVPQVPSYFISVPFLAFGGLLLLYFAVGEMLLVFAQTIKFALSQL